MTTRSIKTIISIGGSIAGSLPSSVKKATTELNRLKAVQAADVAEANRLKTAIRGLARGSDEYKTRVQQLREAQSRIGLRTDQIGKVGAASRQASGGVGGLTRRLGALKAGAGPVGLALGAVAGIVLALGAAFTKAGAEANSILLTSAQFGVSSEGIQRGTAYMREFTQDAGQARQRFESLLKVGQDFQRIRYGEQLDPRRILAATRLGINVNDLIQGEIDPTALFERVAAGFGDLAPEEARLRAEVLLGPELGQLAAAVSEGNLSVEEANRRAESARILSDQQLKANQTMGQNIDEIRQKISELLTQVTSYLIPPTLAIARKLAGYLSPEEQREDAERRFAELPSEERAALVAAGGSAQDLTRERTPFRETASRVAGGFIDERVAPLLPFGGGRALQAGRDAFENRGQIGAAISGIIPRSPEDLIPRVPSVISEGVQGIVPQSLRDAFLGSPASQPTASSQAPSQASGSPSIRERFPSLLPQSLDDLIPRLPSFGGLIGRQTGGITKAGESTLVGEDGPEIARFPAGTEIITNKRVMSLARSEKAVTAGRAGAGRTIGQDGQQIDVRVLMQDRDTPNRATQNMLTGQSQPSTVNVTQYITINNPASELDIERSLAEAAGRVSPGATNA